MTSLMAYRGIILAAMLATALCSACAGSRPGEQQLDIRPLEENRAFEIVKEVFAERGYHLQKNINMVMSGQMNFEADFRAENQKIAVEYLTEQDRILLGSIPPPAAGSRLHVISVRIASSQPEAAAEAVYVIFIDDRNYLYQINPTSERRADVTFQEVDSRLRRDLTDYISWYESMNLRK